MNHFAKKLSKTILLAALPLAFLASLVFFNPFATQATGESALWHFDETSGTTASDSSGNNNNGTLVNDPVWTAGSVGNALQFDGTNDYVSIPNNSSLVFPTAETFIVTFKINSLPASEAYLFDKYLDYHFLINSSGKLTYAHYWNNWSLDITGLTTGVWYTAAATWDGSYAKFYLNGVLRSEGARSGYTNSGMPLNFGRYSYSTGGGYFNGNLDEVKMYSRALSDAEVLADYQAGGGTPAPTPSTTATPTPTSVPTPTPTLSPTPTPSGSLNITSWSSTGGTTTNKDNAQDTMYLANQADSITFTITATGATSYKWLINKADQNINLNTFTWTVPSKKDIWEIRVEASGPTGTASKEWVVSTLSLSEAPAIFEYFTDGKYTGRTETDPWGRGLRVWTTDGNPGPITSNKYLETTNPGGEGQGWISNNTNDARVALGTWKFRARIPGPNGDGTVKVGFLSKSQIDNSQNYQHTAEIKKDDTQHFYFYSRMPHKLLGDAWIFSKVWPTSSHYSMSGEDLTNANFPPDDNWHEYTIVREKIDGVPIIRMYVDNEIIKNTLAESFCYNTIGKPYECDESFADYIWYRVTNNGGTYSQLDEIEIYKNTYLYPDAGIVYKNVGDFKMWENGASISDKVDDLNTIQIGWNKTLSEIAQIINNPSIFEYNATTKIATSHVNLTIVPGGKLMINGEALVFDTSLGTKRFRVMNGATLEIYNSNIQTNSNNPFRWFFTSDWPYAYEVFSAVQGPPNRGQGQFNGILIIKDSIIDNGANLILDHPKKLILENVLFDEIKEIRTIIGMGDIEYNTPGANYEAAFELYLGDPIINLTLKNLTFNGVTGTERIRFAGGDPWALKQLKDSKLKNVILQLINTQDPHSYYYGNDNWPERADGRTSNIVELINSKLINANTDLGLSPYKVKLINKYYLDVKVIDNLGNSISGATTVIANNVDASIKSDNLNINRELTLTHAEGFNAANNQYWKLGGIWDTLTKQDDMNSTTTGLDGHTPLPTNKSQTMLLTDYISERINGSTITTDYNYTITASSGGKTATISGVNPDETWYRTDANSPTKTVICNIDSGSCSINGITPTPTPTPTSTPTPGPAVPSAPQTLTSQSGDSTTTLSWLTPSSNGGTPITSYKVYRGTTSGTEILLTTGGCSSLGNVLTCTDSNLTNGTTYYYQVTAFNSTGESLKSNETIANPQATKIQGTVSNSSSVPIAGATVSAGTASTTTNASGFYTLSVPAGIYTITVTAASSGYTSQSKSASVITAQTTTVNFTLTSSTSFKSSDFNTDNVVNSVDFGIMMSAWYSTTKPKADINQDGIVNSVDFGIMMSEWG